MGPQPPSRRAGQAGLLLPILLLLRRYPVSMWGHPLVAPVGGIAILLALFMIDSLFNSMINPVFVLGAGGLAGLRRSYSPFVQRRLPLPWKAPPLGAGAAAFASRGPGARAW